MSDLTIDIGVVRGPYPERSEARLSALDELGEHVLGAVRHRLRSLNSPWLSMPTRVDAHRDEMERASDTDLLRIASETKGALYKRVFGETAVARSFALIRELSTRVLGQRHHDVQLVGGSVLLQGMVAEMDTGEGKTLTATLPASTAALAGLPVHVVTVNDYLARRDAEAMGPLYRSLGLTVGVVVSGMDAPSRRAAYGCDVTYVTNKELVFDYLKDRLALGPRASGIQLVIERLSGSAKNADSLLLRGLQFAIVDEADSVLIDEARTPLIIAGLGSHQEQAEIYAASIQLARELERGTHFDIDSESRRPNLTELGREHLAGLAGRVGGVFSGPRRRETLVVLALTALHCFVRDRDFLVRDERIEIIDEFTGRTMPDRSWEHGLHQMIEAAEGLPIRSQQETLARISYQRFFRRYLHLAGMTGTGREVARELQSVYRLSLVRIPPNRPSRRIDGSLRIAATSDQKWTWIGEHVKDARANGRPVLVGTRSVAASESLSDRLRAMDIPHRVLNARQDQDEAEIVAAAGEPGRVTVATNMAGRGTDIRLGSGVSEAGGLHVIASECHEARRIDRQLFGRCGRQGDPGSTETILSLEDEIFQLHAGALGRRLAQLAVARGSRGAGRIALVLALRLAQRNAERLNGAMRRELMKRDARLDRMLAFSGRFE